MSKRITNENFQLNAAFEWNEANDGTATTTTMKKKINKQSILNTFAECVGVRTINVSMLMPVRRFWTNQFYRFKLFRCEWVKYESHFWFQWRNLRQIIDKIYTNSLYLVLSKYLCKYWKRNGLVFEIVTDRSNELTKQKRGNKNCFFFYRFSSVNCCFRSLKTELFNTK